MLVSRYPVALTSPPEGSAAMSMLARASLPACFAFLTLSYTLLRVLLTARVHRPMASTKVFARWFRTAQSRPMVPAIEAAAEDAAAGHHRSAQDIPFDDGRRVGRPWPPPGGSRPLLGTRSCPEALERCRAALPIPTDGLVDRRTAGRSEHGQGAAKLACSFLFCMRIGTYVCTCRIYVCVVQ